MDLTAILAGVGAILSAAGGIVLVVREFRRRDHKATSQEIETLSSELHACRRRELEWRAYAYDLQRRLVDHGETLPPPPES